MLARFRSGSSFAFLALRNLQRQPRRTAVALGAIAFGTLALLLAGGFIEWIFQDMRESMIHTQLGHLQVVRPGYFAKGQAEPFRYLLPGDAAAREQVARVPGIDGVGERLSFAGLVSHGEETLSFLGEAVDVGGPSALSVSSSIVDGAALQPGDSSGVVVGEGLARNLGVKVGDTLVVLANRRSGAVGGKEVTVRGLFSTVSKAYDDSVIRMPIETGRSLLGVAGAHVWIVLLARTELTDQVVKAVRARLPAAAFEVVPWYELADFYNKTVALFSRQMNVVKAIIAAIIVLSISNTMMMNVVERTGEIGAIMALGTSRRRLIALFVAEGAWLGIIGAIVGALLAGALAMAISTVGIPMPPPPGMAHGYIAQIRITRYLATESVLIGVLTTLVASVYPAWRASQLEIVDALRHNH